MTPTESIVAEQTNLTALAAAAELSGAARALVVPEMSAAAFFNALVPREHYRDAVSFLAHWLPAREAIWWGCECVWHVCRPEPDPVSDAALGTTVTWILAPTEQNRVAAELAGRRATMKTPAGCVALAAAWSGGSLSPYAPAPVAPPEHLSAQTVASAVELIVAQAPADKRREHYLQLLRIGTEVAQGSNHWADVEAAP